MSRAGLMLMAAAALTLTACGGGDREATPEDYASEREATEPLRFRGYECTQDCSGHRAGYDWAARRSISDPDACGGRSQSFIEGCRAYAGENGY